MDFTLIAIGLYVLAQLAIGWYISRRITTEDDYLVAGRSLGYGVATFTIFATWFGAETCIGAAGRMYTDGLSGGSADPFGYALCLVVMGLFLAVPLWRMKLTTLGDLFRIRYSKTVERVAVIIMAPTSLLWAAAQIRAFGQVLSASSGAEVELMISLAAAIVILYTMFGGLLADAWTDLIQGVALMVGLVVLFVIFAADGGLAPLSQMPAGRLNLFGGGHSPLQHLEHWLIPLCGSVVAAELASRVIAARSPQVAQRATLMGAGIYLLFGLIPVLIGLVGAYHLPELGRAGGDPEQLLPMLAQRYLPGALYAIFAGALVSAILSTVDSALLVASSLISHNVIVPMVKNPTEAMKVKVARIGVAIFGVLAYVLALYAEGVYALVEEASSFGSAGIFTVIMFGLFTKFGGKRAAMASLVAGIGMWVLGAYVLDLPLPYIVSLGSALLAYLAAAPFDRRHDSEAELAPTIS